MKLKPGQNISWFVRFCLIRCLAMSDKIGNFFSLTEEQMERPRPNFFSKSHWVPRIDDCQVTSGIVFINRNRLR